MNKCGDCETPCEKKEVDTEEIQLTFQFQDSISKGDNPRSYGFVGKNQSSISPDLNLTTYHTSIDAQGDYLRTIKEQRVNAV